MAQSTALDRDMTTKYGGFHLYVVAPKAEKALRSLVGRAQPDHNGIRWKRDGWTAVKQYGANLVSVSEVWPQKKANASWKRLDAVLTRITAEP